MTSKIFLEVDRTSQPLLDDLKLADPGADVAPEERLVGDGDLLRVALAVTPAVAFVIGRYFSYLEHKVLAFTVRDADGRVIAAKGDGAERLLGYFLHRNRPSSSPLDGRLDRP
jgi:hypothetical protein